MSAHLPPRRAEQIRRLFDQVVDLPPAEREAFLDEACGSDPTLREDMASLVDHTDDCLTHSPVVRRRYRTAPEGLPLQT